MLSKVEETNLRGVIEPILGGIDIGTILVHFSVSLWHSSKLGEASEDQRLTKQACKVT